MYNHEFTGLKFSIGSSFVSATYRREKKEFIDITNPNKSNKMTLRGLKRGNNYPERGVDEDKCDVDIRTIVGSFHGQVIFLLLSV